VNRARHVVLTVGALVFVIGTLAPGRALAQAAQAAEAAASAATFGVTAEVAHVIGADEFASSSTSDSWDHSILLDATTGFLIRGSSDPLDWYGPVRLPAGAVITRVELAACTATTGSVQFALLRSKLPPGTGVEEVTPVGNTGIGAGCARYSVTPASPLVVDNLNATYWVRLHTVLGSAFDSVRVFYRLQVSPAPGAATFTDVPTAHPFFQFVEALVTSGITAGCGGGNYCPNDPVTRGQMAVFLSKALGLHFAP
jgi:hypothetical protein